MSWTRFKDMHSGGSQKLDWAYIYIEAPRDEAEIIFQNRFGRNPYRVTCTCCGEDYSIDEDETLEQATAFERHCRYDEDTEKYVEEQEPRNLKIRADCGTPPSDAWGLYITLEDYTKRPDIKIIYASEIKPGERKGELHDEGYVWVD